VTALIRSAVANNGTSSFQKAAVLRLGRRERNSAMRPFCEALPHRQSSTAMPAITFSMMPKAGSLRAPTAVSSTVASAVKSRVRSPPCAAAVQQLSQVPQRPLAKEGVSLKNCMIAARRQLLAFSVNDCSAAVDEATSFFAVSSVYAWV